MENPRSELKGAPLVLFFLVVIALVLLAVFGPAWMRPASPVTPGARVPDVDSNDRSQPPDTPEMLLCYQFRNRKNAGDPTTADLLGPAPVVPAAPVSPEEADRLQTEFFLRQDLRIVGVGWDAQRQKPVLYTHGNVSAPTLYVQTGAGIETAQRTMANPDLVVEVRDGRIFGVAARLHL